MFKITYALNYKNVASSDFLLLYIISFEMNCQFSYSHREEYLGINLW